MAEYLKSASVSITIEIYLAKMNDIYRFFTSSQALILVFISFVAFFAKQGHFSQMSRIKRKARKLYF